jgi:hypothetical protein
MRHELCLRLGLGPLGQQLVRRRQDPGLDDIDVGSFSHSRPRCETRRSGASPVSGELLETKWAKKVAGRLPLSGPPLLS